MPKTGLSMLTHDLMMASISSLCSPENGAFLIKKHEGMHETTVGIKANSSCSGEHWAEVGQQQRLGTLCQRPTNDICISQLLQIINEALLFLNPKLGISVRLHFLDHRIKCLHVHRCSYKTRNILQLQDCGRRKGPEEKKDTNNDVGFLSCSTGLTYPLLSQDL